MINGRVSNPERACRAAAGGIGPVPFLPTPRPGSSPPSPDDPQAALLSCLIFQQKSAQGSDIVVPERLTKAKERLEDIARSVANLQLKCGIDTVPSEFVRNTVRDRSPDHQRQDRHSTP